jgi:UDP-2,3-diacylglucosamine hydrolase
VLGDLFEYWVGDDAIDPARPGHAPDDVLGAQVADAFAALVAAGVPVYLMHGNRDLLLGEAFLARARAVLLPDPCIAQLPDGPVLLSHGDAWCTLDTAYQAFRAQARTPQFRALFLSQPIEARRERIGQARAQSEQGKKVLEAAIMDVTPGAVADALRSAGVRRIIHGHTHRPARHDFDLDGAPATRWVLPDWHDDPGAPPRGGPLRYAGGELFPLDGPARPLGA